MRMLLIIAIAFVVAVFTQHLFASSGVVSITWQGYQLQTSAAFLVAFMAVIVIIAFWGGGLWTLLISAPSWFRKKVIWQRQERAIQQFSNGLEAAKLGDLRAARKYAKKVGHTDLSAILYAELGDITKVPALTDGKESGHVLVLLTRMKAAEQDEAWVLLKSLATQAIKLRPNAGEILDLLVTAHLNLGEYQEIVARASQLRSHTQKYTQEQLDALLCSCYVKLAMVTDNTKTKQKFLRQALREQENDATALVLLADTYAKPQQKLLAFWQKTGDIALFEALLEKQKNASYEIQQKNVTKWLKKAFDGTARHRAALLFYQRHRKWDDAYSHAKALAELVPEPAIYQTLAMLEEQRGGTAARVNTLLKKALLPAVRDDG